MYGWVATLAKNGPEQGLVDRDFRLLSPRRLSWIIVERRKLNKYLRSMIAQGIKEGVFDSELDSVIAVNVIFTMLSTNYRWFRSTGRLSYEDLAEWYTQFIIRGLSDFDPFKPSSHFLGGVTSDGELS